MIKFFRKIRRRLLRENRFTRYLGYAIGEIILVVVGILIALQFNNWNEERVAKRELQNILNEIVLNLKLDVSNLEEEMQSMGHYIENLHKIQDFEISTPLDSLYESVNRMHDVVSFTPVDYGYAKLDQNSQTKNLPEELTSNLAIYYNLHKRKLNNLSGAGLSEYSLNQLREYLISYGWPITSHSGRMRPPDKLEVLYDIIQDIKFIGIVRNSEQSWLVQKSGFADARARAIKNIKLLQTYLENNYD
jgi:hypothetical protein